MFHVVLTQSCSSFQATDGHKYRDIESKRVGGISNLDDVPFEQLNHKGTSSNFMTLSVYLDGQIAGVMVLFVDRYALGCQVSCYCLSVFLYCCFCRGGVLLLRTRINLMM